MKFANPYAIVGILVLLVIGQSYAASGQTVSIANHVVINEVELNPPSDDTKSPAQWVELYNPTSSPVNIGGWTVGATTGLKQAYTISAGTTIQSQQFIVYHYVPIWFPHAGAVIQLKGPDGTIIDQTPPLSDTQGDGNTWQRIYDGLSTGSQSDWVYKGGTPGFSNGKPPTTTVTTQLSISVSSDKQTYIFGDSVNIGGQVSQLVKDPAVSSIPQSVNLVLSGPQGFKTTFSLYPGNDFKFAKSVKTDQVLGFAEGTYTISASYGGTQTSSTFTLGSAAFVPPTQAAPTTMVISTDKSNYTIGQPIVLLGTVSNVIPLTPVQYKVYDPGNVLIYQGTLFPDVQGKITSINPYQSSVGSSGLSINSVNPVYGVYRVTASYGGASAFTTFALVSTQAQAHVITMSSDKIVYAPGETVTLKGSSLLQGLQNLGLNPSLQIIQTTVGGSSGTQTSGNRGVVPNTANVKTIVSLQTDNTFTYKFVISGTSDGLGNYRAIVSVPQGTAEADFVVVENPADYKPTSLPSSPFSITTDKSSYALGDPITISGKILNPIQLSTQNAGATVTIQVLNSTGTPIFSGGSFKNNLGVPTQNALSYFSFPDANGNFQVQQIIQTGIYQPGTYTLKASYSNLVTSTTFTVSNPLVTGSQGPLGINTDKKVYGVGETVQLTGQVSSLTDASSLTLSLVKPDGEQASFPLSVKNGVFSWSWTIPSTAKTGAQTLTDRSVSPVFDPTINVYGIYRIKITSTNANSDLFFQVSKNPQPNQDIAPIVLMTDKTDYLSTDVAKIWGEVIPVQNAASQDTSTTAQVLIYSNDGQQIYRGDATVNQGGQYYVTVPLHTGVWKTGTYKVYVQYVTNRVIGSFNVTDPFTTSSDKLQLFMTTDTDKYLPGQTVLVTGRTSYIISLNNVDLAFGLTNDVVISEGQAISKKGNIVPKATVPFDQYGSFSYDYKIPANAPLGNYTIIAQVPFGAYNAYFNVVDKLPPQIVPVAPNETNTTPSSGMNQTNSTGVPTIPAPLTIGPTQKPKSTNTFVEKTNSLSESVLPVNLYSKSVGSTMYYPQKLDGLLRVNPGDENSVSVKVSSQDGTCVIGPDAGCKITQSTVHSGSLYQTVTVNGMDYLVGYSGTGVRLEQFSIIPAHSGDVIPDGQWGVEIVKKDQVTRFYYQVTYTSK
ncbi:MAG TPA: lamin tail domain-containing protein [Candidatus Nitrosotalea sp.]|nr:lamin tail domain-containing protein [Candidatus Nitrosotalea sp.]